MREEAQILEGQAYLNFVNSIHSSETRYQYEYSVRKYMKHLNITNVEELLKNACEPRLIEARIIDYIVMLRNPPHSLNYSTVNAYLAAILAFYSMNDVVLNKKKIGKYLGEHVTSHKDRAYTTEEISRALSVCDERMKVIILLLASSGLRIGALAGLQLRHLTEQTEYGIYRLIIYEGTREEYYTFCTPEAKKAVDDYLDYRKRCSEKINPNSLLIREQFDKDDIFAVNRPRRMSRNGIQTLLKGILVKAGLRVVLRETEIQFKRGRMRKEVAMTIGFRKFYNTNLVRANVNPLIKEIILGHKTGLDDNYFRPQAEEILEEYLKAVNLLTINEENRLKMQVERLTEKNKENEQSLKSELTVLKKQVNALLLMFVRSNSNERELGSIDPHSDSLSFTIGCGSEDPNYDDSHSADFDISPKEYEKGIPYWGRR